MLAVSVAAAALVGFLFARWLDARRPGRARGSAYLVVYTGGAAFEAFRVSVVPEGVKDVSDKVYPAGVLSQPVDLAPGLSLYFCGVDRVALADHRALEAARRTVVLRALFSSGGDLLRYLNVAALVVPILIAIYLSMSFGGLQQSVTRMNADVLVVRDVLSKPLVVDTKGGK